MLLHEHSTWERESIQESKTQNVTHVTLHLENEDSLARDTIKEWFKRPAAPEPTIADKDVASLFSGIYGDAKAMEAFLEKENFSPTMKHWMVIAGLDPMAPLDDDSPREA